GDSAGATESAATPAESAENLEHGWPLPGVRNGALHAQPEHGRHLLHVSCSVWDPDVHDDFAETSTVLLLAVPPCPGCQVATRHRFVGHPTGDELQQHHVEAVHVHLLRHQGRILWSRVAEYVGSRELRGRHRVVQPGEVDPCQAEACDLGPEVTVEQDAGRVDVVVNDVVVAASVVQVTEPSGDADGDGPPRRPVQLRRHRLPPLGLRQGEGKGARVQPLVEAAVVHVVVDEQDEGVPPDGTHEVDDVRVTDAAQQVHLRLAPAVEIDDAPCRRLVLVLGQLLDQHRPC
uniref:Uncharacterized protein n=1 Tax=Triticum urartu TaxID=4572 RepID=A0A8R7U0S7_TRIUA